MASHRAQLISTLLANALTFGCAEIFPEREPLKVNVDSRRPSCANIAFVFAESGHRHADRYARYILPTFYRW